MIDASEKNKQNDIKLLFSLVKYDERKIGIGAMRTRTLNEFSRILFILMP